MTDGSYLKKLSDMQTQIKELVPDSLKENGERRIAKINGFSRENKPIIEFGERLILCKDCEYFTPMSIYGYGLCDIHCNGAGEPEVVSETYYCAWADRREE